MPYSAEISRVNPGCFIFLLDQSGSMSDTMAQGQKRKSDVVADSLNRLLMELSIKCAKEEGVRDYFQVAVIGYGARVGPALQGTLSGQDIVQLSEIASNPLRVEQRAKKVDDGAGGVIEQTIKLPVWIEPSHNGGTPMSQALKAAFNIAHTFVTNHPDCFPPVVLNLTDGEATDGDPSVAAAEIRSLASSDGNALLFNLHISTAGSPIIFPDSDSMLTDKFARQLFEMSSMLPAPMCSYAAQQGVQTSQSTRGFVFNADIVAVVQFLDIGTRATDLR